MCDSCTHFFAIMTMCYQNPSMRCKSLSSSLKDRFSKCSPFAGKFSASSSDAEDAADEEDEVLVSEVMSKYVESKCKRKSSTGIDTLRWALSPQHFLHPQKLRRKSSSFGGSKDESSSAASIRLSRCSSATSYDEFFSVKTRFSRSSSLNRLDFQESSKHSIVLLELYHYEGWPFGLCKKAFLLPPLPKSPSDSWSWRKR